MTRTGGTPRLCDGCIGNMPGFLYIIFWVVDAVLACIICQSSDLLFSRTPIVGVVLLLVYGSVKAVAKLTKEGNDRKFLSFTSFLFGYSSFGFLYVSWLFGGDFSWEIYKKLFTSFNGLVLWIYYGPYVGAYVAVSFMYLWIMKSVKKLPLVEDAE